MRKSGYFSILLAVVLLLGIVMPAIPARAAEYSGSGTMADPYLVTNAEQLQNMRENLSAHYKLANTIDLTGVDFKPIGRLDGKFTGSFVCELNADNTPKYVIKNLSIHVKESSYSAQNKNKWEAALFGATDGATIMGIYVLDAKISNDNFGDNTGAVIYGNYKPGMDEMNSAILIGEAENTTVTNCGTTGVIDSRANHCGGLIGYAKNCIIENCYSLAEVTTAGFWNVGGLIGSVAGGRVLSCFSTGDVKGGQSRICSFIGCCSAGSSGTASEIEDCYTTGNATGMKEVANNFAGIRKADGITINNCFATGALTKEMIVVAVDGKDTIENCYTIAGKLSGMPGFAEADMETIKANIAGPNWDMSGDMPRLVNIGVVEDASAYQPLSNPGGSTTPTTPGTPVQSGADKVAEMINALPDPEEENAITLEQKNAVKEAFNAYEALTTGQKDDFDATLFGKLMNAKSQVSMLLASDIYQRVVDLPEVDKLALEHISAIEAIWDDYLFLDDEMKQYYDTDIIEKIEAMHAYALEHADDEPTAEDNSELTTWDWVLIIGSGVVIVIVLTFDIAVGIYQIRRAKNRKK